MAFCKILLSDGVTELANVKSVTFKEAVNSGVDLRPGCVSSASIEVEVFNTQANAPAVGDLLYFYEVDRNNTQTLIGEFYAEPVIATKNSYKFTAYDSAQKLTADFSAWLMANQSNFPMTIYSLVSAACTEAGVTLGSSSWPLSTENVQAFYADGLTCRDIISYAAELACRFVHCHSNGQVYFDWYATVANKRIYPSSGVSGAETRYAYKQDGLSYANYTTAALDRVAVHPSGEDDVAYIYPTGINSGNTLNIQNNLLLTGADAALYNAVAQNIYTELSAVGVYRPAEASLFVKENPFRAGDIVAVTDAQGVSFATVVMSQTAKDSGAKLISTGYETYNESDGGAQKALTQLASDIVRINKLKVDWADINTAIITYLTANNVTAQNLTIVDAANNVLATFNANGITLGLDDESHAELDYHSFELYDKDGNRYLAIADGRDASGTMSVIENFVGNGSIDAFSLLYTPTSKDDTTVTIDGVQVSPSSFYLAGKAVHLTTLPPADGSNISIEYITASAAYHYLFGTLQSGSTIGPFSVAMGEEVVSQGTGSSVGGGKNNEAYGDNSTIGGGSTNIARGQTSTIGGGAYNEATGQSSTVGGGVGNIASGRYATVPGGVGNEANHRSQMVFGEYNEQDPSANDAYYRGTYVEIVGNGLTDNSRSNARTLDWNGNEVLAGGLTINGTEPLNQVNVTSGTHNLNDYKTPGLYYFEQGTTLTNVPQNAVNGWLKVLYGDANHIKQFWHRAGSNPTSFKDEYVRLCENGTWGNWAQISGYNVPSVTLNTVSGYTFSNSYFVKKNGWVFAEVEVSVTATPTNSAVTICTLPAGYRPDFTARARSPGQSGGHYFNYSVDNTGAFKLSRNPSQVAAKGRLTLVFPVAD